MMRRLDRPPGTRNATQHCPVRNAGGELIACFELEDASDRCAAVVAVVRADVRRLKLRCDRFVIGELSQRIREG